MPPSPPPPFHNVMCFLFCVFFDPSLAARLCCGEARVRVALLCYFWQQLWLVAVEGRGDRNGFGTKDQNRSCLRDCCLRELLCDDCVRACHHALTHIQYRAGMQMCSFNTPHSPDHTHLDFFLFKEKSTSFWLLNVNGFLCFCHMESIFLFVSHFVKALYPLWGRLRHTACSDNTKCKTFTLLPPRF